MAFPSLPELVIDDSAAVALVDLEDVGLRSSSSNSYKAQAGYSLLIITDGELYIGGADAGDGTASLMPPGAYLFSLYDGEVPYVRAPTGETVGLKRVGQGFKGL